MAGAIELVQVSDCHLSLTHSYFTANWDVFVDEMAGAPPAFIVNTGDVSFNGPAAPGDLAFAKAQHDRLPARWRAVAGNHDIGEAPMFSRLNQPVNSERIATWRAHFSSNWWMEDLGAWRLIGLDTALMGSALAQEAEQLEFLRAALADRGKRPVMVFMHMPPFSDDPLDPAFTTACVPFPARAALLDLCAAGGVKAMACGHCHVYRRMRHRGMAIVWAPGSSFTNPRHQAKARRRYPYAGYLRWTLEETRVRHELVEPPLFISYDMTAWTNRNGTTTTLPPRPQHR